MLRTSVIVTWADVVTGSVAGSMITERIPLTLDLEVQVHEPARLGDRMVIEAAPLKAGRTVAVAEARVRNEDTGAPIAYAIATFFASPNPAHVFPDGFPDLGDMPVGFLPEPVADRAGITIVEPGVAEVPHRGKNLNASNAIQGGIVSLAAEEAVRSLHDEPVVARRHQPPLPQGHHDRPRPGGRRGDRRVDGRAHHRRRPRQAGHAHHGSHSPGSEAGRSGAPGAAARRATQRRPNREVLPAPAPVR